jgi:hypothetical protein
MRDVRVPRRVTLRIAYDIAEMQGDGRRQLLLHLQSMLADLYRTNDRALELAQQAGLDVASIPQSARPKSTWWSILIEADNQRRLPELVELARKEYPRHEGFRLAAGDQLNDVSGPEPEWAAATLEVVIDDDDLLPVAFLAAGAEAAKSVVRIAIAERKYASGFLIANDVVLTNHHVLPTADVARGATIEVGVEETIAGVAIAGVPHKTHPDALFASNEEDDWAVVKIDPVANTTPIALVPSATPRVNDRVFIIQHPGGGPKQVALGANPITFVDGKRLQYLTDTRPGSSGSPVFDRCWRLIGMHHSGGWLHEPSSKRMLFRNEGIAIGLIRDALAKLGLGR